MKMLDKMFSRTNSIDEYVFFHGFMKEREGA
jgi:hypothetical protein